MDQGMPMTPRPVAPCGHARVTSRKTYAMRAGAKEYMGSDGRRKYTMEEAFQVNDDGEIAAVNEGRQPPWSIGWQTAERNLAWNDELKERLIKVHVSCLHKRIKRTLSYAWHTSPHTWHMLCAMQRVAADQLKMSEEELDSNLASLQQLLPDLTKKMRVMKPELIAKLAASPDELAVKLIQLKQIFPLADTAKLVCSELSLVLSADLDSVAASARELRDMLPDVNVDK